MKKQATKSSPKRNLPITPRMFDMFWEAYPRKVDKGKTLTTWKRICGRKDRPGIITIKWAILQQSKTVKWAKGFIPHSTTWLNQSMWIDDPNEMNVDYFKPIRPVHGHKDANSKYDTDGEI